MENWLVDIKFENGFELVKLSVCRTHSFEVLIMIYPVTLLGNAGMLYSGTGSTTNISITATYQWQTYLL